MAAAQHKLEQSDKPRLAQRREYAEFMNEVSKHLSERDRALVQLVYDNGAAACLIARATGINSQRLYVRLKSIERRLNDPVAQAVWANRHMIVPGTRKIVLAYFIEGLSVREVRKRYRVPLKFVNDLIRDFRRFGKQWASKPRRAAA